jgi:hypothetical protein
MKHFQSSIDIHAPPEAVWAVLIDTANWPGFDPYSARLEGRPALGETLTVYSTLAPGRAFALTVTAFERASEFAWAGGLPLGMLKNVRTHTLTPRADGGTHFVLSEVISGPMEPLIAGSLPDLTEPFAAFCTGLKSRVEGTTP